MDLISAFMNVTKDMASPPQFRLWCAISLTSTILSRRTWTSIEGGLKLFGNTFVFLVSRPGIGKSRPVDFATSLLRELPDFVEMTGDEVTRQEMIQHMGITFNNKREEGDVSFLAPISEFSTFMPEPDLAWMQGLARLWDCPPLYTRRTKNAGMDFIYYPYFCMLAGVQPAWFAGGFPPGSYELGLPARIFFVYADEKPRRLFFGPGPDRADIGLLRNRIHAANRMSGECSFTADAKTAWNTWAQGGFQPVPSDSLMSGYAVRRDMHAAKLALISAASAHPEAPEIRVSDLEWAWSWMFDMEEDVPTALAAAGGNTWRSREEMVLRFVADRYAQTDRAIGEAEIRRRLGRLVPTDRVRHILDELIKQQALRSITPNAEAGMRLFVPGGQK